MDKISSQLLEESLNKLDAAISSSTSPLYFTRGTKSKASVKGFPKLADAQEDAPSPNTSQDFSVPQLSYSTARKCFDNMSFAGVDVTGPVTALETDSPEYTSTTLLMEDDPGFHTHQVLFSEFVNILVSHPSEAEIWAEVSLYEEICSQQVKVLQKIICKAPIQQSHMARTKQVFQQLVSERNTWRLLGSLYSERTNEDVQDMFNNQEMVVAESDLTIVEGLYDTNKIVKEAQLVVDWLERNSRDDSWLKMSDQLAYYGDNHIAYENTLRIMKNEKKGLLKADHCSRLLVTSLDPDAPLRQNRQVHDIDQEDENRLLKYLFAFVRAGQVSEAQDLCIRAGHHWRAATLEGWKLHHDPNINDHSSRSPIQGNPYRDIWKAVAWRIASDSRLPVFERALYGSLCGHLDSMLNVSLGWEDALWSYTRTLVDQCVEEQLRASSRHLRQLHRLPMDYPEERFDMESIFEAVEQRPEVHKEMANQYIVIQKNLILDDIKTLIETVNDWLSKDSVSPQLLRCVTHLVLVLRRLGRIPFDLNDMAIDIIHAYTKDAIERGDVEQVAWYTSFLPPWLQVKSYAQFLTNIADDSHRQHALHLADKVGLDVHAITVAVVTAVRFGDGVESSDAELVPDTTSDDKLKISAIDWLLYDPAQRFEAMKQSNAIIRAFLISRKITPARMLIAKIPPDSVSLVMKQVGMELSVENCIKEHLCFSTFLDAQASFTDWFEHCHQNKPQAPKKPPTSATFPEQISYDHSLLQYNTDLQRWKNTLEMLTKHVSIYTMCSCFLMEAG